jgi:uncharacterized protein YndB with AHSA1/START domain
MNAYATLTAPDTVVFERLLPGPIERAWSYLVDSQKRALWLASGPIEPRVGGRVELSWDNSNLSGTYEPTPADFQSDCNGHLVGEVTAFEAPRRLGFTWGSSEVTFQLTPQAGQVLLVLTHRRLEKKDLLDVAPGWHTHLDLLAAELAEGEKSPFWAKFLRLREEYAQRLGLKEALVSK